MNIDGNQYYFSDEEAKRIRARIMELPPPEIEAVQDFHKFLEILRRNADLYSSLMFGRRNVKLVDFNLANGTAAVKDEEGTLWSINLQFKP